GDLWYDWLAGIPGHQTTAVRRELLTRLRFDINYRIAADHDLLFRARAQHAKFFNCDEVVAVYASGGTSAQNYALCKLELLDIARSHGNSVGANQFYSRLNADEQKHRQDGSDDVKAKRASRVQKRKRAPRVDLTPGPLFLSARQTARKIFAPR